MFSRRKKIGVVALSVVLLLALVAASCGPGAPQGDVVKYGLVCGFTGPAASSHVALSKGTIDYMQYVNDQGGIAGGVRVELVWEDNGSNVARTLTSHKRFKEKGVVVYNTFSSGGAELVTPWCEKDELPMIMTINLSPSMVTRPLQWQFGIFPEGESGAAISRWIKEDWGNKEGSPRLGCIMADISVFWTDMRGMKHFSPIYGAEFLGYEIVPYAGCIDATTELLRMMGKKPDYMWLGGIGATAVTLAHDVARLEIKEKGVKIIGFPTYDESMMKIVGRDTMEGWYINRYGGPASSETHLQGMAAVFAAAKEYRGWGPGGVGGNYLLSWVTSAIGAECLRMAIEKVGAENVTGRVVRDCAASMENFDTGLLPPMTMSDEQPWYSSSAVYKWEGGRMVPVTSYPSPSEAEMVPEIKEALGR